MAEENQVMKEPQGEVTQPPSGAQPAQQMMKEPQRVTTKNPKKVEVGKRLAESNHKKREAKKQAKLEASGNWGPVNQYYRIGAVLVLGVIGGFGHLSNQERKQQNNPKPHPQMQPQTNKFEME